MDSEETRVDAVVKTRFPLLSRRQVEEAIESGLVVDADGNRLKKGDRVDPERLQLRRLTEQLDALARGDKTLLLRVVSRETDFVIADKPVGMPCEPKSLLDGHTVTQWAIANYPEVKRDFPEPQPLLTPHPIDTEVSGLLVVARTKAGLAQWKERFEKQRVTVSYLVWCWGEPKPHRLFITAPLGTPPRDAVSVVRIVRVMKRPEGAGYFLAELQSTTNLPDQVRLHMASQGYPLVGDTTYDPLADRRLVKPPQLQLRVFQLEYDGHRATASTDEFRARLT